MFNGEENESFVTYEEMQVLSGKAVRFQKEQRRFLSVNEITIAYFGDNLKSGR